MFAKIKNLFKQKSFIKITVVDVTVDKVFFKFETSNDLDEFFFKNEMSIELMENQEFDLTTVPESILIIPAICNVLPIIWFFDSTLIVNELDEVFYKSIPNIKQGYKDMYKKAILKGKYKINSLKNNNYVSKNKYLAFFSAGVDSVAMAVKYMDYKPNLITLWGSDVPLTQQEGWDILKNNVDNFSNEFNLNNFYVKSDFRQLLDTTKLYNCFPEELEYDGDWWHAAQHGISIISHATFLAYLLKVKYILFASSHKYSKEDILKRENIIPSASSPIIDNEIKFASCQVIHDGWENSRSDKIKEIIEYKHENGTLFNLHVCWYSTNGKNCNVCEKCARTYFNLMARGENPSAYGFNVHKTDLIQVEKNFKKSILNNENIGGWSIHKNELINWNDNKELFMNDETYWRTTELKWILDIDFNELYNNFD